MTGPNPGYPGQNPDYRDNPQPPQYGATQQPPYGQPQYGAPQQPQYGQPRQPHTGQPPYGQAQPPQYGVPQNPPQFGQQNPPFGGAVGAAVNPKLVPILWGVVGASVVLLIAAFLPWASVEAGPFSQTVSGTTDGRDGVFTLVLALIAGGIAGSAVFLTAKQPALPLAAGIGAVVAGVISALIAIIDIVDIQGNAPSGLADVSVSVGFGLWLTLLAAVVLAAAGGALLVVRRQHS